MKIQNPIRSRIDSILKLTNLSSNVEIEHIAEAIQYRPLK